MANYAKMDHEGGEDTIPPRRKAGFRYPASLHYVLGVNMDAEGAFNFCSPATDRPDLRMLFWQSSCMRNSASQYDGTDVELGTPMPLKMVR
ncbi:hypothetical protein P7L78_21595 [Tistrella bauzanensis]|uniref:Uncharacterized protein n=1 Tax=Tistrella arctica TaxID=3133430 RepID=A0ABU9YS10_9PROT